MGEGHDRMARSWRSSCSSPGRWTAASRRWRCSSTTPRPPAAGADACSPARTGPGSRPSPPAWVGPARHRGHPRLRLLGLLVGELTAGERVDYLICDEVQFYAADQIDQLARIVDDLGVDVIAVGILTDFRTRLFPGSQRLVELCDRVEVLQVRPCAGAGAVPRTTPGRWTGGWSPRVTRWWSGTRPPSTSWPTRPGRSRGSAYEVLCRRHHRRGMTRSWPGRRGPSRCRSSNGRTSERTGAVNSPPAVGGWSPSWHRDVGSCSPTCAGR